MDLDEPGVFPVVFDMSKTTVALPGLYLDKPGLEGLDGRVSRFFSKKRHFHPVHPGP